MRLESCGNGAKYDVDTFTIGHVAAATAHLLEEWLIPRVAEPHVLALHQLEQVLYRRHRRQYALALADHAPAEHIAAAAIHQLKSLLDKAGLEPGPC